MEIFLSYRRADSELVVGRLYDRLVSHFSVDRVFRDLDSLPIGKSFPQALDEAVSRALVALIVIGPIWSSIADSEKRRRLDNPSDFVRIEVERVLASGIPVVPVLVNRATMPDALELPESLKPLTDRQAVHVRPDPDFHRDMDRLIGSLSSIIEQADDSSENRTESAQPRGFAKGDLVRLKSGGTTMTVIDEVAKNGATGQPIADHVFCMWFEDGVQRQQNIPTFALKRIPKH